MDNKPRKPWIAGLLSLIQPGLGQVYNGEIQKALPIYILPVFLLPGMVLCLNSRFVLVCLIGFGILAFGYYALVFIDAVGTARRLREQYLPKKYNTIFAYIGIYLVVAMVSLLMSSLVKANFVQAYKFPSESMEPTLLAGDHILVDKSKSAKNPGKGSEVK